MKIIWCECDKCGEECFDYEPCFYCGNQMPKESFVEEESIVIIKEVIK